MTLSFEPFNVSLWRFNRPADSGRQDIRHRCAPAPDPATNDQEKLTMRDKEKSTDSCCRTCCYWSELIAKTHGGLLVAMCLAAKGPRALHYTRDDAGCSDWEEARDGAIDAT